MMNELLEQKAKELAHLLTQTDEYNDVKVKQQKMFADETSMSLLKNYSLQQQANAKKQELGQLTQEDMKALEQTELKMYENELIKEFHEAQTNFQRLLNAVVHTIIQNSK